ncbi:MAG: chemotaxis protein CheA [Oligoflexia bacterium]|nr:chemotaxis protein CheA [Oligoflexia bacterium]
MSTNDHDFLFGLRESFIQEVHDMLLMISDILLEMEHGDPEKKHLEKIIRFFHNIKGSGSAVDFSHLASFCHKVEDLLVAIRVGNIEMNSDIMDLLFKTTDTLKDTLNKLNSNHNHTPDFNNIESLVLEKLQSQKQTTTTRTISNISNSNSSVQPSYPKQAIDPSAEGVLFHDKNIIIEASTFSEDKNILNICETFAEELVFADVNNRKSLTKLYDPIINLTAVTKEKSPRLSNYIDKLHRDLRIFITKQKQIDFYYSWYKEITAIIDLIRNPQHQNIKDIKDIKANASNEIKPTNENPNPSSGMIEHNHAIVFEIDQKLLDDFLADANEQLEILDSNLMIIENFPQNPGALDAIFRCYHTIKSSSAILQFNEIEKLAHKMESLLVLLRDLKIKYEGEIENISINCFKALKERINEIRAGNLNPSKKIIIKFNDIISAINRIGIDGKDEKEQNNSSTPTTNTNTTDTNTTVTASTPIDNMIKVNIDRLDRLIDTIGELVIAESMVSQSPDLNLISSGSEVFKHLDHLNKITRSLQEIGMSLRMVPLKQTFKKLIRIIRDVSKGLHKEISYTTFGEDTEVDKTVVDKINDPLVHMVRNSIDHGIESNVEDRISNGKAACGKLEIKACHKGGNIWIEIKDDGRGLDKDKILKKAIEKNIIRAGQNLSEKEIFALIFRPGFSTAEKVTDISGRGVGMDVVRRNIEELHGHIDIDSEKGKGTTFRIRIPNTLAIIEGMVIEVNKERYIIPTQYIERAVRIECNQIMRPFNGGNEIVIMDGENLPLFKLGNFYNVNGPIKNTEDGIVLILDDSGKKIALLVDQILKKQQFVIKQLNSMVNQVPGISGGTIMSDGKVGLILDAGPLIQGFVNQIDTYELNEKNNRRNK